MTSLLRPFIPLRANFPSYFMSLRCSFSWSGLLLKDVTTQLSSSSAWGDALERADPNPLNICYLTSPVESPNSGSKFQQLIESLQASINSNTSLLYRLPRTDFKTDSWQTSTRLLVVLEQDAPDAAEYQNDFRKVLSYIARGGRVLLLLDGGGGGYETGKVITPTYAFQYNRLTPEHFQMISSSKWTWLSESLLLPHHSSGDKVKCQLLSLQSTETGKTKPSLLILLYPQVAYCPKLLLLALQRLNIPCQDTLEEYGELSGSADVVNSLPQEDLPLFAYALTEHQKQIMTYLQEVLSSKGSPVTPLRICHSPDDLPSGFSWSTYQSNLHTKRLGHCLLWSKRISSSWTFCENLLGRLPMHSGLVVTSAVQTKGKGRGNNLWITPKGQAAFTFHLSLTSDLGLPTDVNLDLQHYVTSIQHLVSLSIVLACRRILMKALGRQFHHQLQGPHRSEEEQLVEMRFSDVQLLLKWPNDVYVVEEPNSNGHPSSKMIGGKLAGVLVRATAITSRHVECIIGCGVNVANQIPTVCLHDVIKHLTHGQPDRLPDEAEVIACILTQLERLLDRVVSGGEANGFRWAMRQYTRCWMHTNQKVRVLTSPGASEYKVCIVNGIDSFGYLQAMDTETGQVCTLHPDGNSFDMLRNLILAK